MKNSWLVSLLEGWLENLAINQPTLQQNRLSNLQFPTDSPSSYRILISPGLELHSPCARISPALTINLERVAADLAAFLH